MGQDIEPIQPLAGVEALNKNSALHKALAEMQHWQRCARLLQQKLNQIEDRNYRYKVLQSICIVLAIAAIGGWLR